MASDLELFSPLPGPEMAAILSMDPNEPKPKEPEEKQPMYIHNHNLLAALWNRVRGVFLKPGPTKPVLDQTDQPPSSK